MLDQIMTILENLDILGYWAIFFAVFFVFVYFAEAIVIRFGKPIFRFAISILKSVKKGISDNDDVKRFFAKHPKISIFIDRRLDRTHFFGLPLTMFSLAFFYVLFLFSGVVDGIIRNKTIVFIDTRVVNLLLIFRDETLTAFFTWVTVLGRGRVVLFFIIVATMLLWLWRKRYFIIPLYVTLLGSEIFTYLGKIIFQRARPESAIYFEPTYSFPSGHATTAVAFYGFVTYLLMGLVKRRRKKINIFFAGFVLIFLIDFSRLYLGVHYLSDVWGGDLIGLMWLIIGISMAEWTMVKIGKGPKILPFVKKKKTSIALIFAALLIYSVSVFYYQPELMTVNAPVVERTVGDVEEIFSSQDLKFTETLSGAKQEPLSFIIFAKDDEELIALFDRAGWSLADRINLHTTIKTAKTAINKKSYHTAPMTPSFWNLEVHNFGFEKATDANNIRQRHHARFWRTKYKTEDGLQIYVGTASLDIGIKWGITHIISPDIDTERDYLLADLTQANPEIEYVKKSFVDPVLGQNFVGDQFFSDGQVYFLK